MATQTDKNATQKTVIYRAKCLDCKHEWTSKEGYGTPDYCPKCRGTKITISPIGR